MSKHYFLARVSILNSSVFIYILSYYKFYDLLPNISQFLFLFLFFVVAYIDHVENTWQIQYVLHHCEVSHIQTYFYAVLVQIRCSSKIIVSDYQTQNHIFL